jgi:hypothetical protein
VTHIAGVNILYLPGTTVTAGGYLHGKISTTYCSPYNHPAPPPAIGGNGEPENPVMAQDSYFRLYPNPTPGKFTLELKGKVDPSQVSVEILSVLGDKVESVGALHSSKQEFSLSDKPTGLYLVHVSTPDGVQTQKIIKNPL